MKVLFGFITTWQKLVQSQQRKTCAKHSLCWKLKMNKLEKEKRSLEQRWTNFQQLGSYFIQRFQSCICRQIIFNMRGLQYLARLQDLGLKFYSEKNSVKFAFIGFFKYFEHLWADAFAKSNLKIRKKVFQEFLKNSWEVQPAELVFPNFLEQLFFHILFLCLSQGFLKYFSLMFF